MSKYITSNKIIFSNSMRNIGAVLRYYDIGAREDISSPWCFFPDDLIQIYGFEPDKEECKRLMKKYLNRHYSSVALWSSIGEKSLFINEGASTSSIYKANFPEITQFATQHWSPRKNHSHCEVRTVPLDMLTNSENYPHFMKIDTQGAEFNILLGAQETLKKYNPIVIAETWCYEAYKQSPLFYKIVELMYEHGYEIFDHNIAAAWRYQHNSNFSGKMRNIGYHFLFVKTNLMLLALSKKDAFIFLSLLELYGFRDYAIHLIERESTLPDWLQLIHKELIINAQLEKKQKTNWIFKIMNKIKPVQLYPELG